MWKKYKNYNIEVNEQGEVRNYKNKKPRVLCKIKGNQRNNYFVVCVYLNGKQETLYVHRLVAELFIDNPNNYPCVNHIDNNKLNNNVDNLEWCTFSQNTISAFYKQNAFKRYVCKCCGKQLFDLNISREKVCGDCNKKAKVKEEQKTKLKKVRIDRKNIIEKVLKDNGNIYYYYIKHKVLFDFWVKGISQNDIAKKMKCTRQNISKIILSFKDLLKTKYGASLG